MASSIPQFYSDYTTTSTSIFPNDYYELPAAAPLWGEQTLVPLFDDFGLHHQQPATTLISPSQFSSDHKTAFTTAGDMLALPNSWLGCQPDDRRFYEFPDDYCFGLVPEIKPLYNPLPPDHWEIQSNQVPVGEESNMKVGRYSEQVRKERILRYLKKRNQRNFNKTIKYACRKTLADRRIRVRGRFARNNELAICDQDQEQLLNPSTENNNHTQLLYNNNDDRDHDHHVGVHVQMKKDEEEWVQEIRSLMYLPYITS